MARQKIYNQTDYF